MKVISWNTQWFKGLDEVVDVARIVRVARELADFDAICLQEVAVNYPKLTGSAPADQPAELARHLPGFQVFFVPALDEF
jgi:endonuclease/exonuclease/phosphatase family metal-dependent hydrolase